MKQLGAASYFQSRVREGALRRAGLGLRAAEVSGWAAGMDRSPPAGLKMMLLMVFLSANTGRLQGSQITGLDHHLHCVNDYLFTARCSLSITAENGSSFWLSFTEVDDQTTYECKLEKTKTNDYFCSFQTPNDADTFSESDTYEISLCSDLEEGPDACDVLDDEYQPVENIQPNAPCCFTVGHNASQHRFAWKSTYEEHSPYSGLPGHLQYQLHLYRSSDKETLHRFTSDQTHISLDDEIFEAGTEYSGRVRSSPSQAFYKGQWSEWSPEFHFRTWNDAPSKDPPGNKFLPELGKKVFIPLCATALLLSLLCYFPIKKWRQNVFIPNPAPYFDTLYSDCKGDFKSWVVAQENPVDLLKAEETLQIDTVTKCVEEEEEKEEEDSYLHPQEPMEDHAYKNEIFPACDAALLGLPYAVTTMAPSGSCDGDSGCWLYSNTSLEREPLWYCNDYCTLNSFQHPGFIAAEHRGGQEAES